jgi:5-hydroxyisourate hydrolase
MTGKLTTHVLDTAHGCPAAGLEIELWSLNPEGESTLLKTVTTNSDGRTDTPLLLGDELQVGIYELRFEIGPYFRARSADLPEPYFLTWSLSASVSPTPQVTTTFPSSAPLGLTAPTEAANKTRLTNHLLYSRGP